MTNNLRGQNDGARARSGRSLRWLIGVGVWTALLPVAPLTVVRAQEPAKKPAAAPAANTAAGKALFASVGCATCHGAEGMGSLGPQIVPLTVKLPEFVAFVRNPTNQVMTPLPPAKASDAQLGSIFAFLSSVSAPDAAASAAGLTGNADRGKGLFVRDGCYECHGHLGQGGYGYGPRIGPDPISLPAFLRYIRKPSGAMPAYTPTMAPDQDAVDVYSYLQSVPRPVDLALIPTFK